jgi:undecaprenyl-diphosphatase
MLDCLKYIDQTVFLFLNGFHCPFFDLVMYWGTQSLVWLPLYLFLLFLVIRLYKWQTFWILMFAALMIIVSDQLSNIFKDWVARPRPTYEPGLPIIHTVNGYLGGQFGFYSAHASTNLAIAVFLICIFQKRFRYFSPFIIAWAFFMAYTRIYLGVHYPGDIIGGWIAGGLIGWGFGILTMWYISRGIQQTRIKNHRD